MSTIDKKLKLRCVVDNFPIFFPLFSVNNNEKSQCNFFFFFPLLEKSNKPDIRLIHETLILLKFPEAYFRNFFIKKLIFGFR